MKPSTKILRGTENPLEHHGSISTPIYQTATFAQESALACGRFDYSRSGNPTREHLEAQLAALEEGRYGFAFSSGMAALATVAGVVRSGEAIVAGSDLYGGSFRLLRELKANRGIDVEFVDTGDLAAVDAELSKGVRLMLLESPTNPRQRVTDIRGVAEICRRRGTILAVDNSLLSPYLQKPLELGADIAIHSATKFLGGHSDLTAGAVVTRDEAIAERLGFLQNAEGNALAPFECFLLMRGIKTLAVRIEQQQRTAANIAAGLARHPDVTRLHYVGHPDHPGHRLHGNQSLGPGSVLAFETGDIDKSRAIVENTRLFDIAVSFGSVHSSISLPAAMSHASIPACLRSHAALPPDLVRVSIGLEDCADLSHDLRCAIKTATRGEKRGGPDARYSRLSPEF